MMLRTAATVGENIFSSLTSLNTLKVDVVKEVGGGVTEGMGDEVRLTAQGGYMMVRRTK